jgi:uncharacterized membrane protein
VLIVIIAIVLIILVINVKNSISKGFQTLDDRLDDLRNDIKYLKNRESESSFTSKPEKGVDIPAAKPVATYVPPIVPSLQTEEIKEIETVEERVIQQEEMLVEGVVIEETITLTQFQKVEPPKPGFFERNPDIERFIGENLANKIGIGILVLGIGFFVKYAIDQNWINEIGRVFIGILCGGLLLGVAHWLRKTFTAFSSVLVGGGIAVLYLTIAIAFHEYHLFGQATAFLIMVVITGFSVLFSLAYDRKELAVLSLLGGFASPFMVSTGEGNYIVLFTYILILDVGMLVLAYYKKWNLINIIAYVATLLLFASWEGTRFKKNDVYMIDGGLVFATTFYLVFFAMNMINNLRKRVSFQELEVGLLLSNTFLYYAAGMHLLNNPIGHPFRGLFTASLAAFNFIFAFTLYRSQRVDSKVVFLLIGLVLTFASLAAPVQLEGNYITLFWAAEAVLLLWLSQKSGMRLMKLTSLIISSLMIISLIMDWVQIYNKNSNDHLTILLNKGYITSLFSLISLALCFYLARFEKKENSEDITRYKFSVALVGIVILYVSQFLELNYQLNIYVDDHATRNLIIGTYNIVFIIGLLLFSKRAAVSERLMQVLTVFGILGITSHLLVYHKLAIQVRDGFLANSISGTGFLFHYILLALTIGAAVLTLTNLQKLASFNKDTHNAYSWFFVFFFIFVASTELDHIVVWIGYFDTNSTKYLLTQNHKIGFPILWGISSFILIAFGLKWKKRHLRIISLTLFLITLVKLFTVDIRGISEGGKIAAFISLGILLLTVSFMYQRLKKILLKDEAGINP